MSELPGEQLVDPDLEREGDGFKSPVAATCLVLVVQNCCCAEQELGMGGLVGVGEERESFSLPLTPLPMP